MKNNKGFTLFEITIVVSIAVIISILLVGILINNTGVTNRETSIVAQGLNINDALSSVRADIKQSTGVVASYVDGPTTYTSGATQLVLKLSSIDSSKASQFPSKNALR